MPGRRTDVLGRSHALSGVVTGLAVGSLVLHEPAAPMLLLSGLTAAYALAPDLDGCHSTEARSFGFVTYALAWVIRLVSGGHRHGTHSALGVAAFTGAAWLACLFRHDWPGRVALGVIIAVGLAAAADALRPGPATFEGVAGIGAAVAMVWTGYGLALVPAAAALGCAAHIAGDMLTRSGCPLAWPLSLRDYHLLPRPARFTTGKLAEHVIVTPLLLAALGVLLRRDASTLALAGHVRTAG
jgi:membrane-bound metal-dependent hydrolase YbcI (DUF457 family)